MLVAYHKPNVWTIFTKSDGDTVQTGSKPFKFIPGINELDESQWSKLKETPDIEKALDQGLLTIECPNDPDGGRVSISAIKDVRDAKKVIAKTYDLKLLTVWKAGENRAEVISACTDQIAKIYAETDKPKSSGDN